MDEYALIECAVFNTVIIQGGPRDTDPKEIAITSQSFVQLLWSTPHFKAKRMLFYVLLRKLCQG